MHVKTTSLIVVMCYDVMRFFSLLDTLVTTLFKKKKRKKKGRICVVEITAWAQRAFVNKQIVFSSTHAS